MLKKNDIRRAVITGYASDGQGIARIDGQVVFVKGALEGEELDVRVLKVGKNIAWGKVERLIAPSAHRVSPACPVYGKCGGCAALHMDYEEELRFKRGKVNDALRRIGGLDLEVEEIIGADEPGSYRNKAIYSVAKENGKTITGFYRRHSHEVISAEGCLIETDYSRRAAGSLRKWMDENGIDAYSPETRKGIRRLFCRYGAGTGQGQVVVVTGSGDLPQKDSLISAILKACPETVSIMRNINAAPGDTVLSADFETLWGSDSITDTLCGLRFDLAAGAFYQVNRDQAQRLYDKALEFADLTKEDTALDLYCGAGTITLCLASRAKEAVGAEIVRSAVDNARENAAKNGVTNVRFICADAAEAAKELLSQGFRPTVITVDPPRKGLLPGTAEIIASFEPERIVYVSCDPATLARDLKVFEALGYKAIRAAAADLFPRTEHIESVVLLSKGEIDSPKYTC